MENVLIFFGGLVVRLLALLLLFALFSVPVVAAVYAWQGAHALRDRARGTVDAGGGVHWKPGVLYSKAHTWVEKTWGEAVRIGVDDVARRILAGATAVTLPPPGTRLHRGDTLAAVQIGRRLAVVPCPVEGVVLERNRSLTERPSLFETEPYRAGWMLRIEPDAPVDGGFRRGVDSRSWLKSEGERLDRFFEHRLGIAAADGGTLTAPPAKLLDEAAWHEAVASFLRAV